LLLATGIFVWFAGDEGGFSPATFLLGGLLLLGLLAVAIAALGTPRPPRSILLAAGLLAAFAAWSYLSLTWAADKGTAWDGANRTVLYALVFALFALWPLRADGAALLLGAYGLGVAGVGLVELLRANDASQSIQFFFQGRLSQPVGYVNANVALWFSAFWPCVLLSGRRDIPAPLRGLLLGSAGLLASLVVLGQSRGWLFVFPLIVVLAVLIVPGRGRTIASVAAVAAAILIIRRPLLDVYEQWHPFRPPGDPFSDATHATLIASLALALAGFGAALLDRWIRLGAVPARRISAAFVVLFVLGCAGTVAGYAVLKGDPVSAVSDKWRELKHGGTEPHFRGNRLRLAVTTYRYDYWRVAWHEFTTHPFKGVGVDNFARDYLARGKSIETPKYPHSTELRPLSQTGIVGGLLFVGALAAALAAAFPALRRPGLAGTAAGGALVLFAYFMIHGALEWLWEFAGLGGPAFAMLGIAAALGSGRPPAARRPPERRLAGVAVLVVGLVIAAGLAVPWLAARDLERAREVANKDPKGALDRLDRSAKLNPLSPLADETAALVLLRTRRTAEAKARLRKAIDRDPTAAFPYLELGAIASLQGRRAQALRLIRRGHALTPRDGPTNDALRTVERGRSLTPERLDKLIVRDIHDRIPPE
jgi:O-antigen ligase